MDKKFLAYVLVDPRTNMPRYVGITNRSLKARLAGHLNDIYNRPDLNKHKTAWFKQILLEGLMPRIEQIAELPSLKALKQFEIDYIKENREKYDLINQTPGGDWVGFNAHSRESILKKKTTRAIVQYNILGEKIAEFEMTEDVARTYNMRPKACSHITQCCKGTRKQAYGYVWRYRGEELGDISDIDPRSASFNKIVQYSLNGERLSEYDSYIEASRKIGDNSHGANIKACCLGEQKTCKGYVFQLEPTFVYFDQEKYENVMRSAKNIYINRSNCKSKVRKYSLDGKFIQEFSSLLEAARSINLTNGRHRIKECCENLRDNYKGFFWKYAEGAL